MALPPVKAVELEPVAGKEGPDTLIVGIAVGCVALVLLFILVLLLVRRRRRRRKRLEADGQSGAWPTEAQSAQEQTTSWLLPSPIARSDQQNGAGWPRTASRRRPRRPTGERTTGRPEQGPGA